MRIAASLLGQRLGCLAAKLGQQLGNARQLARLVARLGRASVALGGAAVEPVRRNIGRVGFHHDGFGRQRLGQSAHLQRTVKRERAAKTELESHANQASGLLRAPIEGMGNATRHRHLTQRLEHAVHRAAHMQQHGQIKAPRQAQLRAQQGLLVVGIEFGNEVVEPDFAHCHQRRVALTRVQRAFERLQIGLARTGRAQRVDPQRVAVAVAMRQTPYRFEVVHVHRRNHDVADTALAGTLAHSIDVMRELTRVQVAVGVDPEEHRKHHAASACSSSLDMLLWRTLRAHVPCVHPITMFHSLLLSLGRALARYLSQPHTSIQTGMPTDRAALAQQLQPGDVLLIEGNSRVSTVIKYFTQSTWSHAAFFVGPQLGGFNALGEPYLLIEADMLDGVCKRPLSHYYTYPTRICRPIGLSATDLQQVLMEITSKLGAQYDLRNVFDLARYFLPALPVHGLWRRRLLALGSGDPTRAICSSLIAEAFQSVGYPLLPTITVDRQEDPERHHAVTETIFHIHDRRLFAPRDFDVSPYFEIVKPTLTEDFDFHQIHWG